MKLVLSKPLQAVVTILCLVMLTLHLDVLDIKVAMAVVKDKQEDVASTITKVEEMNLMIARIDTNLTIIMKNQDNILQRELSK